MLYAFAGQNHHPKYFSLFCNGFSAWLIPSIQAGSQVTLAYDNICNLDRLKVAKSPLPLPEPLDTIWIDVTKIIDVFHFPNPVSTKCKTKYSPEKVKAENPLFNTQAGEQTFVRVEDLNTSYVL